MKKQQISIKDIAKICNVSTATVSLVLNDSPKITQKTKEKVLKVIKEYEYYPNIIAKRLSKRITSTIAVIVPQISHIFNDYYFAESLSGIYDTALKYDYEILLQVANKEFVENKKYLRLFKEGRIDGALFVGSTLNDEYLKDFQNFSYPFLLVNSYLKNSKVPYIKGDAVEGGYIATKYLISKGRKKLAFIAGSWDVSTTIDKFEGYKKALQEFNINFDNNLIFTGNFTQISGSIIADEIKNKNLLNKIDAIFSSNDLMAMGLIEKFKSFGVKVPDDIAIVGFDNNPLSEICSPKITTVFLPVYEIASQCCEYIIKNKIENKEFQPIFKTLPVKLIIRESA